MPGDGESIRRPGFRPYVILVATDEVAPDEKSNWVAIGCRDQMDRNVLPIYRFNNHGSPSEIFRIRGRSYPEFMFCVGANRTANDPVELTRSEFRERFRVVAAPLPFVNRRDLQSE